MQHEVQIAAKRQVVVDMQMGQRWNRAIAQAGIQSEKGMGSGEFLPVSPSDISPEMPHPHLLHKLLPA